MTSNEIRSSFLKYFGQHGHRIVPSSPLVPHEDPTLLFTNAGMNQFKDVFLGRERRDYRRAVTSQKCMRVSGKHNDLDNVGPSFRHHTFFEMLGNFSFGDYFKPDAIRYAWELLTEVWKMPPDRLVVSIFKGEDGIPRDEEAYDVWRTYVPEERILELDLDDNFWQMGETGPCGRCSEIYYTRSGSKDPEIEVWNNVFMEFERDPDGSLNPLPAPSIDTGMGLERISAVLQGASSNYDTDLFSSLLANIADRTGQHRYRASMSASDVSMRVVADHARAMTFLIADGVIPSNEWRGYVLRKIMRRAMRHGRHLGMSEPFLHSLVAVLARDMGDAYPEIRANQSTIERTILTEENRFEAVLTEGLPRLEAEIERALESSTRVLPGESAFRLYDTFGLPYDFIEDTAATQDVTLDREGYDRAMEGQREKARAKSSFDRRKGEEFVWASPEAAQALQAAGDRFEGYASTLVTGVRVLALFDEQRRQVEALGEGASGFVALERTPFYLEAGGQVSDSGSIYREGGGVAQVEGLTRPGPLWPRLHLVRVSSGALRERDLVTAEVDAATRDATRRNHTATHLLHAALRKALGSHVKQAGSLVAPDRLRFDFAHFAPVTERDLAQIERLVNEQVYRNTTVETEERSTDEAMAAGAMALFGEKYGDRVRVVSVPGFSMELCGGTHCRATGDIGLFTIVSEGGVAAGVRRIEAVTGAAAIARYQAERDALHGALKALNVPAERLVEAVEKLQGETKRLNREVGQLRVKAAAGTTTSSSADTVEVAGVKILAQHVSGLDKTALRNLADSLRDRLVRGVVVLGATTDGKVGIVVSVSKDLTGRVHAGEVIKKIAPIVGGGGGGRPDFAEAGGKDASKVDEMLAEGRKLISEMLERT